MSAYRMESLWKDNGRNVEIWSYTDTNVSLSPATGYRMGLDWKQKGNIGKTCAFCQCITSIWICTGNTKATLVTKIIHNALIIFLLCHVSNNTLVISVHKNDFLHMNTELKYIF